jgi:hypothetical protein
MPLHDWKDDRGWDSVHHLWLSQLLDWVQPRLPAGYRAYIGSVPALTVDTPNGRPDLKFRRWNRPTTEPEPEPVGTTLTQIEPDREVVTTLQLDPQRALHIDLHGLLIAAIELVSPRNKDRPSSREGYLTRYAGYLHQSVHLLLVDVLPRPAGFSFADALAQELGIDEPACPAPCAVSYRVGEPVPEGTVVALWQRPLHIGQPLPTIPLALDTHQQVPIDLEHTYHEAARRAYLS